MICGAGQSELGGLGALQESGEGSINLPLLTVLIVSDCTMHSGNTPDLSKGLLSGSFAFFRLYPSTPLSHYILSHHIVGSSTPYSVQSMHSFPTTPPDSTPSHSLLNPHPNWKPLRLALRNPGNAGNWAPGSYCKNSNKGVALFY